MAFSMAAEIERDLISARTREALRARIASGLPLGRPRGPGKSKLDRFRPEIWALLANGSTQKFIAKRYNTTPGNLSNWIKKNGIRKPGKQESYGGIGTYVRLRPDTRYSRPYHATRSYDTRSGIHRSFKRLHYVDGH